MNQSFKNITGRWHVACLRNETTGSCQFFEETHVWVFQLNGILVEHFPGGYACAAKYDYYPARTLLLIDRSDYEEDGFMDVFIKDRYHIEFPDDDCCSLRDLDKPTYVLELKKIVISDRE